MFLRVEQFFKLPGVKLGSESSLPHQTNEFDDDAKLRNDGRWISVVGQ
jgi:hypothetical protein